MMGLQKHCEGSMPDHQAMTTSAIGVAHEAAATC
jgi:hypothetical protein